MIKECFAAKTDILFNDQYLKKIGLDPDTLKADPTGVHISNPIDLQDIPRDRPALSKIFDIFAGHSFALRSKEDRVDAVAPLYDQLKIVPYWWILELIPLLGTFQQEDGSWLRQRRYTYALHL